MDNFVTLSDEQLVALYADGNNEAFDELLKRHQDKVYTYTEKNPISILEFSNAVQKGKVHPTQKPVALLEYLIKTYTNEGETVLDNCMGSGSTGVACINTNRNFIGYELDEHYFQIAKERLEQHECKTNI